MVGPAGHITGLDLSAELLAHAKDIVREAGLSDIEGLGKKVAPFQVPQGNVDRMRTDDLQVMSLTAYKLVAGLVHS